MSKPKTGCRFAELSIRRGVLGCELTINSSDTAKAVFSKHTQRRFRPLAALLRSALGHQVMIAADGEEWMRTHDAIVPHLHTTAINHEYVPVIKAVAGRLFDELADRSAAAGPIPAPIDIDVEPLVRGVIASVMGYVLFGEALRPQEAQYLETTLSTAARAVRGRLPTLVNGTVAAVLRLLNCSQHQHFLLPSEQRRAVRDLLAWINAKVDTTELRDAPTPFLDSLKCRFANRRAALQRRAIVAELTMMLVAGIETTAATLTFALAEIANSPTVREEIIEEVRRRAVLRNDRELLTLQYPCLYRIFRETLRRHTIVPTMLREAETDLHLSVTSSSGVRELIRIKRGSVLRFLPLLGNMRRSIWERPHRFDPGRFARPLTEEQRKGHHMFGLGPQSCPGRSMAVTEAILILKALFERLDIEQKDITQNIPVERNALLTIRPVGVTLRVVAALPNAPECTRDEKHVARSVRDRGRNPPPACLDPTALEA